MPEQVIAFAPGRVNLIGEHTDYNEGLALPFAISEGVTVRAEAINGDRIKAVATDLRKHDDFELARPPEARGWRAFVRGAVAELQRAGIPVRAAQVEISGDVPRGGGLSSSAALEVALTLALIELAGVPEPDRIELAKICSKIENDWVGAQTGLLDQLASLLGEDDHALRIDFRSLEITQVPLELGEFKLVTLHSGDRHSNAGSGYNERRRECALAAEELGVPSLRDATLEAAAALAREASVPVELYARQGDPADAILDVAEEQGADLIVVGNKGMTGAKRFLLGSVPNKISHHAPCSVLIIRTT